MATVLRKVPHIYGWPLLGSQFALKHDRLNFLQRLAEKGDVSSFRLGFATYFLVNEPFLVEKILVERASDFDRGGRLRKNRARDGIVTSAKDVHRQQRKTLAPFFQPRHIAIYADEIVRHGEEWVNRWRDGASVADLHPEMATLTMNILGKVVFDLEKVAEDGVLAKKIDQLFRSSVGQLFSAFTVPKNWATPSRKQLHQAREMLTGHVRVLTEQLQLPGEQSERTDILALMLQARSEDGASLSLQEIARECWPLFFAGYNTSPIALVWMWYLLGSHPEISQKVQDEVDSVLGGRSPTYADLAKLPYCLQVVKEGLRLYPPAPMIRREALKDMEIDGFQIPRGAVILISPYTMHRKPEYFPDPEVFNPDHFQADRLKALPRYAYMPFGGGPRVCLGNHFAMMEQHLLLATIAQRARFELAPDHPEVGFALEQNLALRPDGVINVHVHKR